MLRRALAVAALVVSLAAAGCITHTEFEPMSAIPEAKVTDHAVRFFTNDAPTLKAAGGELIGTVGSSGNKWATQGTLSDRALSEAADHGGTHVMRTAAGYDTSYFTTAGSSQTNCSAVGANVNCNSSYTPPIVHAELLPHASFVVVRVPPERWAELPPALRPAPTPGLVIPDAPPKQALPQAPSRPDAVCAQRAGTFVQTFTTKSGNCGEIGVKTITVDRQPTEPKAPCTGTLSYSEDNCTVTARQTCPAHVGQSSIVSVSSEMEAHWSNDGSTGGATLRMTGADSSGAQVCAGEYFVASRRE